MRLARLARGIHPARPARSWHLGSEPSCSLEALRAEIRNANVVGVAEADVINANPDTELVIEQLVGDGVSGTW